MDKKLEYSVSGDGIMEVNFEGNYISYSNEEEMQLLYHKAQARSITEVRVTSDGLGKWDSSLVVVLFNLAKICRRNKVGMDVSSLPEGIRRLLSLAFSVDRQPVCERQDKESFIERLGGSTLGIWGAVLSGFWFSLESLKSIGRFFVLSAVMRKKDFYMAWGDCSYKALPIVALIAFMIGLIFAFVGAVQLKTFGAQIYVASLVAIAMVRVMGAITAGIIMAGRTGASYAATIGTMQVNEEVDALRTMGISVMDFLILPRMLSLMLMMPLLTVFADVIGMLGGAFVGLFMLGLSSHDYWRTSIDTLNINHFLIGIFHGFVFGCIIAICGCYYGIKCGRSADSVGKATTSAVVSSIVWIIVATAVITVICQVFGI